MDFGGFNVENNIFNNEIDNECESEKRVSSDNGSLCQHTSDITSPSNDTAFNFGPTGVALAEFVVFGYVFDVVLNENEFYYNVNNIFNNEINDNDIINASQDLIDWNE